jgi:hypothetical protein
MIFFLSRLTSIDIIRGVPKSEKLVGCKKVFGKFSKLSEKYSEFSEKL